MCAGAMAMARIGRLVFAACDPKGGRCCMGPRFFEQTHCPSSPRRTQDRTACAGGGGILKVFSGPAAPKTTPAETRKTPIANNFSRSDLSMPRRSARHEKMRRVHARVTPNRGDGKPDRATHSGHHTVKITAHAADGQACRWEKLL
jgi:tRNA(Arg) A34 adenosine deaminase TadA